MGFVGAKGHHEFRLDRWREEARWVDMQDRLALPHRAGVYVVTGRDGQPLYVGMTAISLRQRWSSHHRVKQCVAFEPCKIAYFTCSDPDGHYLYGLELQAIYALAPLLNGHARPKPGPKRKQPAA